MPGKHTHTRADTQPGSRQIVIWIAVVVSITKGLTESLPPCLSFCHCRGSQSAKSHSLTLVPITQLYVACLAKPAAFSHTYLWDNFWQNKDRIIKWHSSLCFPTEHRGWFGNWGEYQKEEEKISEIENQHFTWTYPLNPILSCSDRFCVKFTPPPPCFKNEFRAMYEV